MNEAPLCLSDRLLSHRSYRQTMENTDCAQIRKTAKGSLIYFIPIAFLSEVSIISRRQKQEIIRDSALFEEKKTNGRDLRRFAYS